MYAKLQSGNVIRRLRLTDFASVALFPFTFVQRALRAPAILAQAFRRYFPSRLDSNVASVDTRKSLQCCIQSGQLLA
jgi:hypothetical protein